MYNLTFDLTPFINDLAPYLMVFGAMIALWILGMVAAIIYSTKE